jgi:uncharacterized protein YpiB (UPF0302 family)
VQHLGYCYHVKTVYRTYYGVRWIHSTAKSLHSLKKRQDYKIYTIQRRFMLSRLAQAAAKMNSEATPILTNEIKKTYSTLLMTDQITEQDTSKTNHPTGLEITCETETCKSINCANNTSECDPDTLKAEIAFHTTHSLKSVEPEKITATITTNDAKEIYAIIHEEKEKVSHAYDKYRHADTKIIQEDYNTKKIQEALRTQEEKNNYEQDERENY